MDCCKSGTNHNGVQRTHLESLNIAPWKSPAPPVFPGFKQHQNGSVLLPFSPQTRLKSLEISLYKGTKSGGFHHSTPLEAAKGSFQRILPRLFLHRNRKTLKTRSRQLNSPKRGPHQADEKVELQKGVHGTCCLTFEGKELVE